LIQRLTLAAAFAAAFFARRFTHAICISGKIPYCCRKSPFLSSNAKLSNRLPHYSYNQAGHY
jgi:hypothetical protein